MSLKKCDDCGGFNSRCEFSPRAGHYYICRDCGGDCYMHEGTYKGLMQEVIDQEEEPSRLLKSAESVGEAVCDHKVGLSRCMEYGVEVVTIAFLSDDENDDVDKFKHCPDCGSKL